MAVGTPIRYAFKEEFESEGQRFFGTSYSVTGVIFAGGRVEGDVSLPARGQDVRHSGNAPGERYRLIVQGGVLSTHTHSQSSLDRTHSYGGVLRYTLT